jgi:hypothetical protein
MGLLVQRRWEIHLVKKMVAEIEPDKRCYLFNTFSPTYIHSECSAYSMLVYCPLRMVRAHKVSLKYEKI